MQHNHFGSFAPERKEQVAKYFICGQDYMSAVADAILQAQEEIYIAGWWLSPEIYLKRGSEFHENMRLDRLLKKKAVSHNVWKSLKKSHLTKIFEKRAINKAYTQLSVRSKKRALEKSVR